MLAGLLFIAATTLGRAEEAPFSHAISPEDFNAAGLQRLTPAERKHLDEMVSAYKQGLVAAAQHTAEEALVAQQAAQRSAEEALKDKQAAQRSADEAVKAKQVAEAETKAAKAEAIESKGSDKGFFAKAKVKVVPGTKIEYAEIKTTVLGKFEGWSGRTIFNLANGQRWQVANSGDRYFTPPVQNVEVEIRQASLGGFWMFFPAQDVRVRVKLLGNK